MTQQDTQPPAETLANLRKAAERKIGFTRRGSEDRVIVRRADLQWMLSQFSTDDPDAALTRRAGGDAAAAEERDALLAALGWKPGPFRDALSRKVILDDCAALRPEMVKARQAAQDAQSRAQDYHYMLGEYVHGSRSGVLGRLWEEVKRLRGAASKSSAGGDAEAVARAYRQGQIDMRDRAAAVCDERGAEEQEGYGLNRAAQNYFRARNAVRALEPAARALPAPVVEGDERLREALAGAFRLVDGIAGAMNGVPNEPADDQADIIAGDLTDLLNLPFDENWPAAVAAALSEGRSHG